MLPVYVCLKQYCLILFLLQLTFIETYIPEDVTVYLIGHSIGAYIILELLENVSVDKRVAHCYLLFPTIEFMAETPNGKTVTKILKNISFLIFFLVWLFNWLPICIQMFLIRIYASIKKIPSEHHETIRKFLDPYVLKNFCHMGLNEMTDVRERNNKILRDKCQKIKLYYGTTDSWVPLSYYRNIKSDIPQINAEVCSKGFAHAFVLRDARAIGNIVADWIATETK